MKLLLGDCLELMKTIPSGSVDMVMCDLPYGTTQNKWDSVIPLEPLWKEYRRLCKGVVVLTAAQPFTSVLVYSNLAEFKYQWVWQKSRPWAAEQRGSLARTRDAISSGLREIPNTSPSRRSAFGKQS